MNRTQKERVVAELQQKFRDAKVALVTTYTGLSVKQTNQLRSELREVQGECRIAKNTLTRRALEATPYGTVNEWLVEDTALFFGFDDPVATTKIVARWAGAEAKKLRIKGGVLEGEILVAEELIALSRTPPKEELQGKLLALLQMPATQMVRLLSEPATSLARLLAAREKQLAESQQD